MNEGWWSCIILFCLLLVQSYFRVGTPLPYFIGELLYVKNEDLEHTRTIPLHVATVNPKSGQHSSSSEKAKVYILCTGYRVLLYLLLDL